MSGSVKCGDDFKAFSNNKDNNLSAKRWGFYSKICFYVNNLLQLVNKTKRKIIAGLSQTSFSIHAVTAISKMPPGRSVKLVFIAIQKS